MKTINEVQKTKRNFVKDLKRYCDSYKRAVCEKWSDEKRLKVFHKISITKAKIEILDWFLSAETQTTVKSKQA